MVTPGREVKDISIETNTDIDSIFSQMYDSGGFESRNLSEGANILTNMINEPNCLKFLSFVGALISTGTRGIIKDFFKRKWCDVGITTCGALDHDIARFFSNYKEGSFTMDDKELLDQNIHRLGNVLVPKDSYGPLIEEKMQKILGDLYNKGMKKVSTSQICQEIGKNLGEGSFLYEAQKNDIPVVVPGIMDGAVGSQCWLFSQNHPDFQVDVVSDSNLLSGLIFKAEKSGALMLGGGISKHHTLWWNQYRDGLDYAVYLTTAQEFDGSLSGALVREAISWGKVTQVANQTTIHCEVTTILPFLYSFLISKVQKNP